MIRVRDTVRPQGGSSSPLIVDLGRLVPTRAIPLLVRLEKTPKTINTFPIYSPLDCLALQTGSEELYSNCGFMTFTVQVDLRVSLVQSSQVDRREDMAPSVFGDAPWKGLGFVGEDDGRRSIIANAVNRPASRVKRIRRALPTMTAV